MDFELDYDVFLIPTVFADKGHLRVDISNLSLNTVWKFTFNKAKGFFDIIFSHILLQIVPEQFNITLDSYSDLTLFIGRQLDLIINHVLNELLMLARYNIGQIAEQLINQPINLEGMSDYAAFFFIDPE